MAKPPELDIIDNRMNGFLQVIQVRQRQYLKEHGQYFQGLSSHKSIPKGIDTTPDNLDAKPHDRPHGWNDVAPDFPSQTMSNVELHMSTRGYTVILTTIIDDVEWRKLVGFEGDLYRSVDWHEVIDDLT